MFYAASKEIVEQMYPDIANYQPEKTRCTYVHPDTGLKRFFDRIVGYYFSDQPWGLGEDERVVEGLDQEFVGDDYLSLNIRNNLIAPEGWTFVSCDYAAQELRLGAINTKAVYVFATPQN